MRNDFIIRHSTRNHTVFPCTVHRVLEIVMRGAVMRIDKANGRLWEWYIVTCNHCGSKIRKPVWWLKLLYIFKRKLYFTCNECHSTSCYINFFLLIHDTTDEQEKLMNKYPKWDKRIR